MKFKEVRRLPAVGSFGSDSGHTTRRGKAVDSFSEVADLSPDLSALAKEVGDE